MHLVTQFFLIQHKKFHPLKLNRYTMLKWKYFSSINEGTGSHEVSPLPLLSSLFNSGPKQPPPFPIRRDEILRETKLIATKKLRRPRCFPHSVPRQSRRKLNNYRTMSQTILEPPSNSVNCRFCLLGCGLLQGT